VARVLLVDDEQSIRTTLGEFLCAGGYQVKTAEDAETAKKLLQENAFGVVVSDIVLPRLSGVDLLHFIREAAPHVQVIMMTGEPTVETAAEAVRAGASDYLTKPVGKNAILRSVKHAGQVKRLKEENRRYQEGLERLVEERTAELRESNRRLTESLDDLKRTQQQVVQQERLSALGQMASGIAHDFNNVLMPILGLSDYLLSHRDALDDGRQTAKTLETINSAARDAKEVVRRLREFYRPSQNMETGELDLKGLIEYVLELSEPRWKSQAQAQSRGIHIKLDLPDFPPIEANESQLREVFMNLVLNAADAMPEGGVLRLSGAHDKGRVTIQVSDTGVGMSPEVRMRCLEPFFTTKDKHGTGLGLSLCHGIIKRHGGALDIEGEVGRGTTVIVRLPVSRRARTAPEREKKSGPARRPRELRVLAVDDEEVSLMLIEKYLSDVGHTVEKASSTEEAVEKLKTAEFDLVVTGRAMPGLGGDRMAREAKRLRPGVAVIMLTGFGDQMVSGCERPEGVDELVAKPITQDDLLQAVGKMMNPGGGDVRQ